MTSKEKVGVGPGLRLRGVVDYRAPPNAGVWSLAGLAVVHRKTGDKRYGQISSPRRLSLVADLRYASLTRVGVERRRKPCESEYHAVDVAQIGCGNTQASSSQEYQSCFSTTRLHCAHGQCGSLPIRHGRRVRSCGHGTSICTEGRCHCR